MGWSVIGLSLAILCSVSRGSSVIKTTVVPQTASIKAKERVQKLGDLCPDIKYSMRPRHCADLLRAGQTTSGLYNIFLGKDEVKGKVVYCDMDTEGGGWTVIQRRGQFGNRVYYFYRNWTEYAAGFGDPAKEYWFGNRALHALTSNAECMRLKIVLKNHTGERISLDYDCFKVGSEKEHFKMQLGPYLGPDGWDSLRACNHTKFSTFDQDHDNEDYDCAEKYRGGWWYNKCHTANLNGLNLNGPHDSYADGIEWSKKKGSHNLHHYSYPSVTIMARPVK